MEYLINFLPAIITGLFLYYWQRAQERRDAKNAEVDELKEEVEAVNREVNNATMELSYATAIAVERGKTNGELKKAKDAYDEAVKHQKELSHKIMDSQKN